MQEFLNAVAKTLREFGFEDATLCTDYYDHGVRLRGILFQAQSWGGKSFRFCGRTYRRGNVTQAVIDLIRQLPDLLARKEREMEIHKKAQQLEDINKSLISHGMYISKHSDYYVLTYKADLERLESVAKQIAAAEDIILQPLDDALAKFNVTFTAEGGFSLN